MKIKLPIGRIAKNISVFLFENGLKVIFRKIKVVEDKNPEGYTITVTNTFGDGKTVFVQSTGNYGIVYTLPLPLKMLHKLEWWYLMRFVI